MYENEVYSGENAGSNTSGEEKAKNAYFDYTTYPRSLKRERRFPERKGASRKRLTGRLLGGKQRLQERLPEREGCSVNSP